MIKFQAIEVGRIILCSHILLLIGLILPRMRSWDRIYTFMIGCGAFAFFLLPVLQNHEAPRLLLLPLVVLQVGLTFWLWMFAHATITPKFKPLPWHWIVFIIKLLFTISWIYSYQQKIFSFNTEELVILQFLIPGLFSLILTIAAVLVAGRRLADELNNAARRLRRLLIYYGAGAIIITALILFALNGPILEHVGSWLTILLGYIICINLHILHIRSLFQAAPIALATRTDSTREIQITGEDRKLSGRIEKCFKEEDYFRTEGLTVAMLAKHLAEKEYKVRVAINQVLGYRNFNAFLNDYRISAARKTLKSDLDLPVISLSMDLGYRSLAGFNKAFKENTGLTPTEFRRNKKQIIIKMLLNEMQNFLSKYKFK